MECEALTATELQPEYRAIIAAAAIFSDIMSLASRSPDLPPAAIFIARRKATCWASMPSMNMSFQILNMAFSARRSGTAVDLSSSTQHRYGFRPPRSGRLGSTARSGLTGSSPALGGEW